MHSVSPTSSDPSEYPYDRPAGPPSYVLYWVGISLLTLGFLLALVIWPPHFSEVKNAPKAATSILFLGRFHPIAVHLPIGVILFSLLIELGSLSARVEAKWRDMSILASFVTAVGTVFAVMFGIFLSREGDYKGGAYIIHQAFGIVAAFGCIAATFLRLGAAQTGVGVVMDCFRFVLFGTFGLMSLGAHFGGNMSHGSNFLLEYAPDFMAKPVAATEKWMLSFAEKKVKPEPTAVPAPTTPAQPATATPPSNASTPPSAPTPPVTPAPAATGGDKLVFQHVILPILEAKCNKCHNADKTKGDLRMDTYEMAMKGGENGDNIIAGNPDKSLAIVRIMLPSDDDEHMPPEGKDQPTKEEIELLKWWIKEGASNTLTVAAAKIPDALKATAEEVLKK